jgi:predicted nucleotidyltransferase
MAGQTVTIAPDKLAEFCRRNHIRKPSFFGSVLRDDFRPDSDVDVLIEFEPDRTPGFALIRRQDELSELLGGRRVDLVTQGLISPFIRNQVLAEAQVQYAAP